MTAATIPGLDTAPTKHEGLLAWVQEVAELTQPDRVAFADGSEEEFDRLCAHLVEAGIRIVERNWRCALLYVPSAKSMPGRRITGWIRRRCGRS